MTKKAKRSKVPQRADLIVQDCTFHSKNEKWNSEVARTIAQALEANANALQTLCNKIGEDTPLFMIGGPKP